MRRCAYLINADKLYWQLRQYNYVLSQMRTLHRFVHIFSLLLFIKNMISPSLLLMYNIAETILHAFLRKLGQLLNGPLKN